MANELDHDVALVRSIPAIPSILDVVCRTTGMGFAAVARVTKEKWIACEVLDNVHFGLEAGGELPVRSTLCDEVRECRDVIVFDEAAIDPVFADHHTPRTYGLQSYISVPITLRDGSFFGTLCAIDAKPHKLNNPATIGMFKLFAELIAFHIDANDRLSESRLEVAEFRQVADLREQFIAVLGHDLRNPLAAISSGVILALKEPQTEKAESVLQLMQKSVTRMSGLIDNVLDFARGRLGGGIGIDPVPSEIRNTIEQIVGEARSSNPLREIYTRIDLDRLVRADHGRLGQLFSNLLGNAISHGDPSLAIKVEATFVDDHLEFSVANGGMPIPADVAKKLFEPFSRGTAHKEKGGLGLGLYIAAQIAQAHGGKIDLVSNEHETRFTFRMPVGDRSMEKT